MLHELQQLAEEIAHLSETYAQVEGTADAFLIAQIIRHLQAALNDLMEREGMLVGPMPWWSDWQEKEG